MKAKVNKERPTVAQSGNPVNQNVSANDMGAMRSQFESVPKQSQTQSNTIGSMESDWNVPESQRTPILYDTISEAKSLDNARLRLAQDYAGEMAELRGTFHCVALHTSDCLNNCFLDIKNRHPAFRKMDKKAGCLDFYRI